MMVNTQKDTRGAYMNDAGNKNVNNQEISPNKGKPEYKNNSARMRRELGVK